MFAFLICILTLHQVHSACVLQDLCPDNTAVQNEIINLHNAFRRAVQPAASDMLEMSYSEQLGASSQAWVEKCDLDHGSPSTRMLNGYELGENLFDATARFSWTQVISAWHKEVERYSYPYGLNMSTGHYVQIVWNSSYKVGCGVALCPGNVYFYACHYFRAGNFMNWPPYKSGPPCASCPNHCVNDLCTNPCPYINAYLNCPTLKAKVGCGNIVKKWCPASCLCFTEIVPVY